MRLRSHRLIFCLLPIILQCNVLGVQQQPAQHIDRPRLRTLAVLWRHPGRMKPRLELSAKLRTDDLMMMENDVTEPQRKRSFPGNNAPLDRLSVGSMETRQGKKKQSKVAESPRRRSNPPPIDRVGLSRLPTTRG
ncbi:PREDICTED: osteocrin [Poecilia mexicana]|nr:PREDICTED: osteocrin [Poecilia mexicana]XP_014868591.1 PREDICTED: osteocrin [Poecilia mexicana]XP_016536479.1 PREDICTED: osteocrin [Poecilia formosa]XP_016536480.1 PREDICTED: osteocrin [Poecilia formosa]